MFRSSGRNDLSIYRAGYPNHAKDNPRATLNVEFYGNTICSTPSGDTIENIHLKWWGAYSKLEVHHGYIQWLFPIREHGLNDSAQELQLHEARTMATDPLMRARMIRSYALMLDFYGYQLVDPYTGEVRKQADPRKQFSNLISHPHNFLRITRILKCLGELNLEEFKYHWLMSLIVDAFEGPKPPLHATQRSLVDFWIETVKDDTMRSRMQKLCGSCKRSSASASSSSRSSDPSRVEGLPEAMQRAAKINCSIFDQLTFGGGGNGSSTTTNEEGQQRPGANAVDPLYQLVVCGSGDSEAIQKRRAELLETLPTVQQARSKFNNHNSSSSQPQTAVASAVAVGKNDDDDASPPQNGDDDGQQQQPAIPSMESKEEHNNNENDKPTAAAETTTQRVNPLQHQLRQESRQQGDDDDDAL